MDRLVGDPELLKGDLDTIGTTELPPRLIERAVSIRQELCRLLNAEALTDEGIQGPLLSAMAESMEDLDKPARTWARQAAAPLGIECPIESGGGVFLVVPVNEEEIIDPRWPYLTTAHTRNAAAVRTSCS